MSIFLFKKSFFLFDTKFHIKSPRSDDFERGDMYFHNWGLNQMPIFPSEAYMESL